MKIEDIAFWILIVVCSFWIILDLIPDFVKKYWGYIRMLKQDKKRGKRRTYHFKFRDGVGGG